MIWCVKSKSTKGRILVYCLSYELSLPLTILENLVKDFPRSGTQSCNNDGPGRMVPAVLPVSIAMLTGSSRLKTTMFHERISILDVDIFL